MSKRISLLVLYDYISDEDQSEYNFTRISTEYIINNIQELAKIHKFGHAITYSSNIPSHARYFSEAVEKKNLYDGIVVPIGYHDTRALSQLEDVHLDDESADLLKNMVASGKVFEAYKHVPGYGEDLASKLRIQNVDLATRAIAAHEPFKKWFTDTFLVDENLRRQNKKNIYAGAILGG